MWDAVGVVAYALLFSLLEPILIFFILLVLELLLPRIWSAQKRMISIGTMFLTLAAWAVVSQLYFLPAEPFVPVGVIGFLIRNGRHPLRVIWGILLPVAALSFARPAYLIIRSQKALTTIKSFFDWLTVLSSVYLFLDVVGIVIVTIRNV